jgi:hypothetical protein
MACEHVRQVCGEGKEGVEQSNQHTEQLLQQPVVRPHVTAAHTLAT